MIQIINIIEIFQNFYTYIILLHYCILIKFIQIILLQRQLY